MNRRALLRIAAGVLGGGAATAAGLSVATGGAAQTGLTLSVDGDSATIGTDGSVTAVSLNCDIEWQYDLPDETSPATVIVEVAAGPADGEVTTVGSAESAQLFTEASGSEAFDVGLIEQDAIAPADIEPSGTGARETSVTIEARLRVATSGGTVLARETTSDTGVLTVTRDGVDAAAFGHVGGDGSLTISTE